MKSSPSKPGLRGRILGKPLLLVSNYNPYSLGKGLDRDDVDDVNEIHDHKARLNLAVILQFLHIIYTILTMFAKFTQLKKNWSYLISKGHPLHASN